MTTIAPSTLRPALTVSGLTKHFVLHNVDGRRVEGLRGVDLTVHAGEHVALAGSSGAGKSSLLKCVYRTYEPSSGTIVLHPATDTAAEASDHDSGDQVEPATDANADADASRSPIDLTALTDQEMAAVRGRELGYVSQFLRAPPRRTPLDIVVRAAVSRGMDRPTAELAAGDALDRLHLDRALWDVHATVLSGGERQRVNLAAGTVSPPRVLLLDEPVSALDPTNRDAALALIGDLTDHGVAVLSVFHDLDAIARLASRVVLLHDGRIVRDGAPDDVLPDLTEVAR